MSAFFVRRPIVAMVIAIIMVIVGLVAMIQLPIALFPDIAPDHAHQGRMLDFMGGDEATLRNRFVLDLTHAGGHADDIRSEKLALLVLQIGAGIDVRSDLVAFLAIREHPFIVFPPKRLIPFECSIPIFLGPFALMSEAGDHEVVVAKDSADCADDVAVESADRRAHHHDRSHPEDDSQQRQKGTQLLRPDGLKSDLRRVGEEMVNLSHGVK